MAQKVNIILVDDIDGTDATETVSFGLDGTSYEIDLNESHAATFRDALAGYVGNARKVSGARRGARKSTTSNGSGPSARDIREWAPWRRSRRARARAHPRRRPRGVRGRQLGLAVAGHPGRGPASGGACSLIADALRSYAGTRRLVAGLELPYPSLHPGADGTP